MVFPYQCNTEALEIVKEIYEKEQNVRVWPAGGGPSSRLFAISRPSHPIKQQRLIVVQVHFKNQLIQVIDHSAEKIRRRKRNSYQPELDDFLYYLLDQDQRNGVGDRKGNDSHIEQQLFDDAMKKFLECLFVERKGRSEPDPEFDSLHVNFDAPLSIFAHEKAYVLEYAYQTFNLRNVIRFSYKVLLSSSSKFFIAFQLFNAIKFLHSKELFHGNLSPSNIFLSSKYVVKLSSLQFPSKPKKVDYFPSSHNCAARMWHSGKLSNIEYLAELNRLSGRRSFLPDNCAVFPWVSSFSSPDLRVSGRDLGQSKYRMMKGDLQMDATFESAMSMHQLHHIAEFVSELTYYLYMARVTPVETLKEKVRKQFDPKQYYSSVSDTYLQTPDEAIIEYFTSPEILESSTATDFPPVKLPQWIETPQQFIEWHRKVMESVEVSSQLHNWIDVTFGYKLSGVSAIKAKNVPLARNPENLWSHGLCQLFELPHPAHSVNSWRDGIPGTHCDERLELFCKHFLQLYPVYFPFFDEQTVDLSHLTPAQLFEFKKRCDLFSLGCVLFELFSNTPLLTCDKASQQLRSIEEQLSIVPFSMRVFIMDLLLPAFEFISWIQGGSKGEIFSVDLTNLRVDHVFDEDCFSLMEFIESFFSFSHDADRIQFVRGWLLFGPDVSSEYFTLLVPLICDFCERSSHQSTAIPQLLPIILRKLSSNSAKKLVIPLVDRLFRQANSERASAQVVPSLASEEYIFGSLMDPEFVLALCQSVGIVAFVKDYLRIIQKFLKGNFATISGQCIDSLTMVCRYFTEQKSQEYTLRYILLPGLEALLGCTLGLASKTVSDSCQECEIPLIRTLELVCAVTETLPIDERIAIVLPFALEMISIETSDASKARLQIYFGIMIIQSVVFGSAAADPYLFHSTLECTTEKDHPLKIVRMCREILLHWRLLQSLLLYSRHPLTYDSLFGLCQIILFCIAKTRPLPVESRAFEKDAESSSFDTIGGILLDDFVKILEYIWQKIQFNADIKPLFKVDISRCLILFEFIVSVLNTILASSNGYVHFIVQTPYSTQNPDEKENSDVAYAEHRHRVFFCRNRAKPEIKMDKPAIETFAEFTKKTRSLITLKQVSSLEENSDLFVASDQPDSQGRMVRKRDKKEKKEEARIKYVLKESLQYLKRNWTFSSKLTFMCEAYLHGSNQDSGSVSILEAHPSQSLFLACSTFDKSPSVWSLQLGKLAEVQGNYKSELDIAITDCCWIDLPSNDTLLAGASDNWLQLWSLEHAGVVAAFAGKHSISSIHSLTSDPLLIKGCKGGILLMRDIRARDDTLIWAVSGNFPSLVPDSVSGSLNSDANDNLNVVAVISGLTTIICGLECGRIVFLDVRTGCVMQSFDSGVRSLSQLEWIGQDESFLLVAGRDGSCVVWDVRCSQFTLCCILENVKERVGKMSNQPTLPRYLQRGSNIFVSCHSFIGQCSMDDLSSCRLANASHPPSRLDWSFVTVKSREKYVVTCSTMIAPSGLLVVGSEQGRLAVLQ